MKKILFSILSGALVLPSAVFAQLEPYAPGAPHVNSLASIIHSAELVTGLVFGAIAVISFAVAGILFLTAYGEPEKIKTARNAVIWGVAGVVVGIVAFSIIAIVGSFIAR